MEHAQFSDAAHRFGHRAALVVVGALAATVAVGSVALVTFAGGPHGSVYTACALATVGVAATGVCGARWPARLVVGVTACAALGVLGVRIAQLAPPTTAALDAMLDQFEQPGWQLEYASQGGNLICFDECRSASRTYRVDAPLATVLGDLDGRLTSVGFVGTAVDASYGRYERRRAGPDYLVMVSTIDDEATYVTFKASLR